MKFPDKKENRLPMGMATGLLVLLLGDLEQSLEGRDIKLLGFDDVMKAHALALLRRLNLVES